MRIIGNDQKNNGQKFWEILERIMGKISSIIGAGLLVMIRRITTGTLHELMFYHLKSWYVRISTVHIAMYCNAFMLFRKYVI